MSRTRIRIALLAVLATSAAASNGVQAQDAFASLAPSEQPTAAEELERRAEAVILEGGWERAADLYRSAAELRGAADPGSADDFLLAGYIRYYSGRPAPALLALTDAGEAFLALGDVERAAAAFIDGAWVATQAGMSAEARSLGARAFLLTRSPLLRADRRMALARRLGAPPGTE